MHRVSTLVDKDIVLIYVAVEGIIDGQLRRKEFSESYQSLRLDKKNWRGISWTTACSVAAVVDLVSEGKLKNKGFIKQEEIPLESFLESRFGSLYESFKDPK